MLQWFFFPIWMSFFQFGPQHFSFQCGCREKEDWKVKKNCEHTVIQICDDIEIQLLLLPIAREGNIFTGVCLSKGEDLCPEGRPPW